ncbi:esterase/lipase/thioesterase family protein, partial [Pseudomonas syringae pv. actinidiae ICMP 18807]
GAFAKLLSGLAPVVDEVDMFVKHTPRAQLDTKGSGSAPQ